MALNDPLATHLKLTPRIRAGLEKLHLATLRDLLFYFPARYQDAGSFRAISMLAPGEVATIYGVIKKIKAKKLLGSGRAMAEATIEDYSGKISAVWFNQPYLASMYQSGTSITLSGPVEERQGRLVLINPTIARATVAPEDSHDSLFGKESYGAPQPVYPETKGVSSPWLLHTIKKILPLAKELDDYLPPDLRARYSLPSLTSALTLIHAPRKKEDAAVARKRFSFEEIFFIQLARARERAALAARSAYAVAIDQRALDDFSTQFPFPLTQAQKRAVETICADLEKPHPMSRLLEGDVGSGKTAVALLASYAVATNRPHAPKENRRQSFGNLQVAYMAPTEILAVQQFETFIKYFKDTGISVALITGSGCRKFPSKVTSYTRSWTAISKSQLAKWIAQGEIPIVIGTHALIQKTLSFKHLALAIIDEQHRFGLRQRRALAKKDAHVPHLLSMTATPIPRTLALTMYGDLDLSLLDELPAGRAPVDTRVVLPEDRTSIYREIKKSLASGRQLYVICPRIDEPDPEDAAKLQARSATQEAKRLKEEVFSEFRVGLVHSRLTKEKRETVMRAFADGDIDVLVATSVVEVGVNVPNATMMIIEGAERFGLAQLHQLRGRVARGEDAGKCFLFAQLKSTHTEERLKFFLKAKNGFELAEYDLALRGAGELSGTKQWGISDIGMEAVKNIKLVEAAREEAKKIILEDPTLSHYPLLNDRIAKIDAMHFE